MSFQWKAPSKIPPIRGTNLPSPNTRDPIGSEMIYESNRWPNQEERKIENFSIIFQENIYKKLNFSSEEQQDYLYSSIYQLTSNSSFVFQFELDGSSIYLISNSFKVVLKNGKIHKGPIFLKQSLSRDCSCFIKLQGHSFLLSICLGQKAPKKCFIFPKLYMCYGNCWSCMVCCV